MSQPKDRVPAASGQDVLKRVSGVQKIMGQALWNAHRRIIRGSIILGLEMQRVSGLAHAHVNVKGSREILY